MHLTNFLEVCDTIKYNGVTEEALRLRLFPLSLGDRAKHWLTSQPSDSITLWNDLVQKFLTKFFPPSKIAQLVQEINTFGQLEGENLAEALSRPRSRPDQIGESEPDPGCDPIYTIYYLSISFTVLGLSLTYSFSEVYLYL